MVPMVRKIQILEACHRETVITFSKNYGGGGSGDTEKEHMDGRTTHEAMEINLSQ